MSGWLPVYDTMHGIRGEVSVVVKVDLFSDFNKFRQSSCGVQFFFSKCTIELFTVIVIASLFTCAKCYEEIPYILIEVEVVDRVVRK